MNESRKYVVSTTLKNATWNNTEIVDDYSPDAIRALKQHHPRNLYVSGSTILVRAMLADGLIDELHLFMFPLVLGRGGRLFADSGSRSSFTLDSCEAYGNGAVHLAYRLA